MAGRAVVCQVLVVSDMTFITKLYSILIIIQLFN